MSKNDVSNVVILLRNTNRRTRVVEVRLVTADNVSWVRHIVFEGFNFK